MSYHSRTLDEVKAQFWAKVHKTDKCWFWFGAKRDGYGILTIRGKRYQASVVAYILLTMSVSNVEELIHEYNKLGCYHEVCHKCDSKSCVNNEHLYIASHQDNMWESVLSGKNVKLSAADVVEVRRLYSLGNHTIRQLGIMYKISYSQVHRIVTFKRRIHLNI